ncbi:MAG TPA: RDD family protein [Thermoanaerobaculia bacterium]|nr:RDD family protein [Thermoanaerobaculia bacterium]
MICRNHVDVSVGVRRCSRCGVTFCKDCLVDIQGKPYCATCKSEQLLDVRSGVDRTNLQFASIGRRFAAQFLDGLIISIPTMILVFAIAFSAAAGGKPPAALNLWFIIPSIIAVIYEALMLKSRGQTLGKMAMKVKVVSPDGTDVTGGQAWGRAVGRALLGFLYIVDYIPALFTKEKTTLHDMMARTRVVMWA